MGLWELMTHICVILVGKELREQLLIHVCAYVQVLLVRVFYNWPCVLVLQSCIQVGVLFFEHFQFWGFILSINKIQVGL
jgi:hypothetical protein